MSDATLTATRQQPLFRAEAIDAQRDRLVGTVVAAVPPSSRLYTLLLLGVVAVIIGFLVFASYSTTAQVRGVIAYDAGIARVYPSAPARDPANSRSQRRHGGCRAAARDPVACAGRRRRCPPARATRQSGYGAGAAAGTRRPARRNRSRGADPAARQSQRGDRLARTAAPDRCRAGFAGAGRDPARRAVWPVRVPRASARSRKAAPSCCRAGPRLNCLASGSSPSASCSARTRPRPPSASWNPAAADRCCSRSERLWPSSASP